MQDDPSLQSSVFKKLPVHNVFNFACNYKVTLHFSDDELQRNVRLVYR